GVGGVMDYLGFINKELILFTSVYVVVVLVINSIWLHPKGLAPFKEWIIKKFWEYWTKKIRIAYLIIASVILYYLFELFLKLRFQLFVDITNLKDNDVRNLALAFLGTISGIGALFGVYLAILRSETTERQTYTAEQGQITDRINKATEGLGKKDGKDPVLEVRLGALYALERTAQDSIRDHVQIMEILCAYVRTNSPRNPTEDKIKPLPEDIKAAITIIGRRENWPNGKEHLKRETEKGYRIDLRNCDLHDIHLDKANLSKARLDDTNLHGAQLISANLRSAWLNRADLRRAKFNRADLRNARFNNAKLERAVFIRADLANAWFVNANMEHADLYEANISNALLMRTNMTYTSIINTNMENAILRHSFAYNINFSHCLNLTLKQLASMFCRNNASLPNNWEAPEHWPEKKLPYNDFKVAWQQWRIRGKWDNLQLSLAFDNPKE
ncbi:MAG: pentapeptide repeat-containing protein, partial [Proteobacteria bacterium]|nr:pentapeptide repeat-containing protein [Pseudomonadota bacterium]